MKKIFMTLAATVMAMTINAQVFVGGGVGVANTDNGNVVNAFLDGSIGYGHLYNAGYDTDELSLGIKPGIAVKLNNRLSFVTHIGFIGYAHEKDNNTDAKVDNWGLSLDGNNIVFGLYYNF